MNFIIWDLETDSADTNYATIIEVGAILLDENFREKERFSARCRLPQDRVPSATALCVNKSSIDMLTRQETQPPKKEERLGEPNYTRKRKKHENDLGIDQGTNTKPKGEINKGENSSSQNIRR